MTQRFAVAVVLSALVTPLAAQERVTVRRLSDVVAVRQAPDAVERVLYYFDPTAELVQGDEIEQGVGGHSELFLSEGGRIEMHASAHLVLQLLDPGADVLRVPTFSRMYVTSESRPIVLRLPGGVNCRVYLTEALLDLEPGRMRVRNEGGQPVVVSGPLATDRSDLGGKPMRLARGEEVLLPLFSRVAPPLGSEESAWGARLVRHDGDYEAAPEGGLLHVTTRGDEPPSGAAPLTVGGVRARVPPGTTLILHDVIAPATTEILP